MSQRVIYYSIISCLYCLILLVAHWRQDPNLTLAQRELGSRKPDPSPIESSSPTKGSQVEHMTPTNSNEASYEYIKQKLAVS
jgi:hypothetical protein